MPKRNLIWLAALVAAALAAALIARRFTRLDVETRVRVEFDPVTEAYRTIQEHYLYPLEDDVLRQGAVAGMVRRLDGYSRYLPPGEADAFAKRMAGTAWGLGLKVEVAPDGNVVVVGPLIDSPAQPSGLLRGDRILEIDGNQVAGLSQADVERLLDGPSAPAVVLTVRRGGGEPRPLRCRRDRFPLETVQGLHRGPANQWVYLLDEAAGLGYVRMREMPPGTPEHVRDALRQMRNPRAIILDLRGNPGGDLEAAVELAGLFLANGPIATVAGRRGPPVVRSVEADHRAVAPEVRVVVLVDETTASGAELLAGALAWRDRAVLVGCRTLGKGCVQTMIDLGGLGRLHLTTAEFRVDPQRPIQRCKDPNCRGEPRPAPSSRWGAPGAEDPNVWGVDPHVEVAVPASVAAFLAGLRTRAEVVQPPPGTLPATTLPAAAGEPGAMLLRLDPQLKAAVKLARDPARMQAILRRAAQDRAARQGPATATRPASAPEAAPARPPGP